jgi:hypothetical protein
MRGWSKPDRSRSGGPRHPSPRPGMRGDPIARKGALRGATGPRARQRARGWLPFIGVQLLRNEGGSFGGFPPFSTHDNGTGIVAKGALRQRLTPLAGVAIITKQITVCANGADS